MVICYCTSGSDLPIPGQDYIANFDEIFMNCFGYLYLVHLTILNIAGACLEL